MNQKLVIALVALAVFVLWRRQRWSIATGAAAAAGTGNIAAANADSCGCAPLSAGNFRSNFGAF